MNQPTVSNPSPSSFKSFVIVCAILTAVLLVAGVVIGAVGHSRSGETGVVAAAIAGGVVWLAGCLALGVTFAGRRLEMPVLGALGPSLIRLCLPLTVGVLLSRTGGPLAEAGVFGMILANYLVMVVVETGLSLKFVPPSHKPMAKAV